MSVDRYSLEYDYDSLSGLVKKAYLIKDNQGDYVKYEDYKYLSDYCDHLVSFSKLACLPKDLENLREANAHFAAENESLRKQLQFYKRSHKLHADLKKIVKQIQLLEQND